MSKKRKNYGDETKEGEGGKEEVFVGSKKHQPPSFIKLDYLKNDKEDELKHMSSTGTSNFPLQAFLDWFFGHPPSDSRSAGD